ncbi:MAG: ComF family protein [Bacteroidota bacterium]
MGGPSLYTLLRAVAAPARDFIFPPLCFSCSARLTDTESRVCNLCWHSIERIHPDDDTVRLLRQRFSTEGFIDEFYSCYYFEEKGVFQHLVHSLKYNAITLFGIELGEHIGMLLKENIDVHVIDGIIPVPLHKLKQRERGYNQSEFICRGISLIIQRPVVSALVERSKNTISQTHLTADERKKNVGGAFQIRTEKREYVKGKTFLIVDDVITTGSTIQSLAKLLKAAGARKVIAASAALAKLQEGESKK